MDNQLEKALRLARKNNDRLIIYDSANPGNALAVVPLDEYEKMTHGQRDIADLTEQELLDKINRDIAIWKSEQGSPEDDDSFSYFKPERSEFKRIDSIIEDMNPDNRPQAGERTSAPAKPRQRWSIPESRKKDAEEVIEEDTQYLEDII